MKTANSFTRQRREFTKLWLRYRVPAMATVVLAVLFGAGNYAWDSYLTVNEVAHAEANDAAMDDFKRALGDPVAAQRKALANLSDDETLARYLHEADGAARAQHDAALAAALPGSLGVRLVPKGVRKTDFTGMPPLSYAALDLIRDSQRTDTPRPAEVHMVGRPEQHIALVRKVVVADELAGSVLAAFALDTLASAVAKVALDRGYVELIQRTARGRPGVLGRSGDATLKDGVGTVIAINRTRFNLVFWMPRATSAEFGAFSELLPILGAVVMLIIGALVGGVLAFRSKRRASKRVMLGGAVLAAALPDAGAEGALAAVRLANQSDGASPGVSFADMPSGVGPAPTPDDGLSDLPAGGGIEVDEGSLDFFDEADPGDSSGVAFAPAPPVANPVGASIDPAIFRAYDIRGIVGQGLDADLTRLIGRAIGTEAYERGQQALVVARDGRTSSDELRDALVEGLLSTGRDVIDIGCVPTPVLYFSTYFLETGSGVMVTGSHNPANYNGLKIMLGGETLFDDAIQSLKRRIEAGDLRDGQGELQQMDLLADYIRRVTEDLPVALGNAYKIVIDCGNGVAGIVAPKLIQALGHDVVELYCDIDGTFPNHAPDPTQPENLADLIAAVQTHNADLGFAFDGDGDRLGVVDGDGNIIWADRLMMLYASDILSREAGAGIVFDVKCSSRLRAVIEQYGGQPIMDKTGHSYMKNKLLATNAELAGELSGHIFFKERWYGFDDGMYAAARLLEILLGLKRSPVEVFARLPTGLVTPEIPLHLNEGEPFTIMDAVLSGDIALEGAEVYTIDGLRAEFVDSWGLMRASNTSPCIVFRFEGDDDAALERVKSIFKEVLRRAAPGIDAPF
jgi:phosphomannomutase / phosphoglucomutase